MTDRLGLFVPRRDEPLPESCLPPAQNHLIELLPKKDGARLLAQCEAVQLQPSQVVCEQGAALQHAYFPVSSFISLLTHVDNHPSLEVGMVGREGVLGAAVALGVSTAPLQAMVQGSGSAWRISTAALQAQLNQSPALRSLLQRYVYVVIEQMASSAACLRFHLIGPRLARWLLMSEDRAHAPQFHVTHEFLASMLGVRRVGVTVAASRLQRQGLIRYHRGEMQVVDRTGLEAAACSCYQRQCLAYRRQLS